MVVMVGVFVANHVSKNLPLESAVAQAIGQKQPAADFDRLDATAFHAVDARASPPEICRPAM